MKNKQAFTLIELLVVVLIIGILAAVALPQYTLAVNKTRFANMRSTAGAIITAAHAYQLANGSWPENFDELVVDLPGGFTNVQTDDTYCKTNTDIYCCLIRPSTNTWARAVICGKKDHSLLFYRPFSSNTSYCAAKPTDNAALKLCRSFGGSRAPWNGLPTLGGTKQLAIYEIN